MAKPIILAALLVAAAASVGCATTATAGSSSSTSGGFSEESTGYAPSGINFPPQFYVTTGTTIPFPGADPVAQSGAIYYDELNQRVRVDNFWLGNQRSFIVDMAAQQGYIVSNEQCTALRLTGGLKRYGVPDGAIRSLDSVAVRGVPVLHYSAVEREDTIQQVDFFVRPMNLSSVLFGADDADDGDDASASGALGEYEGGDAADPEAALRAAAAAKAREEQMKESVGGFFVPWQIRSKRLRQRTIAPPSAATDLPNWRFFGEPMDEVISVEDAEAEFGGGGARGPDGKFTPASRGAVEKLVEDVTVTVDFFNFVPSQPAAAIFEPPLVCQGQAPRHTFDYKVNVHQAQRLLVDMAFNSAHGRRLMDHLWRAEFVKRVAAGGGSGSGSGGSRGAGKKAALPAGAEKAALPAASDSAERNSDL